MTLKLSCRQDKLMV